MSTIYIFSNFNNYYNRIVKKENTISDYINKYTVEYQLSGVNFVPNDGVNTTHVFGSSLHYYSGKGDYLIEVNEINEIVSRWFVIDNVRDRAGQWTLTLHRDLIVDYYSEVIESPVYIEKAILTDTDPLIYNNEQLTVNQIKTSQELLKDETNSAWLVGYLSAKAQDPEITFTAPKTIEYQYVVDGIENFELYNYSNYGTEKIYSDIASLTVGVNVGNLDTFTYTQYVLSILNPARPQVIEDYGTKTFNQNCELDHFTGVTASYALAESIYRNTNRDNVANIIFNAFPNLKRTSDLITKYSNMVIKDTNTNKYYKCITVLTNGNNVQLKNKVSPTTNEDMSLLTNVLGPYSTNAQNDRLYIDRKIIRSSSVSSASIPAFELNAYAKQYTIELIEIEDSTSTGTIPNGARVPYDAPYKIFCMPYKLDDDFEFIYNNFTYKMNKDTSMAIMTKLITDYSGGGVLYDAQILPYCPVKRFIDSNNKFDLENSNSSTQDSLEGIDYIIVKDSANENKISGFIAFCDTSNFTTNINYNVSLTNKKISNECDKYRLCSPNFNGAFEFNLAKNGGLSGFTVSCTYKPYQPYIKVAPIFSELYGGSFIDARGLICGGEFGLPLINDKWSAYEINNKNYLNSFNRQIENMELTQKYQRLGDIVGGITGAGAGAAVGGFAGGSMAPGVGIVTGAVAGGLISAAGGITDYFINEKLRTEAIDYTKDQFNYSLQNIQALPYTLARVSSLTNDNTIFPILEYYTCTDREKEALANKIAYNSMTVMAIGKIKDYINNSWSYGDITSKGYIKGQLIRLDSIDEDFHLINSISSELNKGVYLKWE